MLLLLLPLVLQLAFGSRQVPLFEVPFSTYTNFEPLAQPKSLSYHYRSVCGRDTARFNTALRQLSLVPDLPSHVRHMGFDALLYFCEYENPLSQEVSTALCDKLVFYGNSYIYHEIYFRSFRATGASEDFSDPASFEGLVLAQDIIDTYGGMKELFEELVEAALSLDGYGWVWLLSLPEGLSVITSPDYDGIHGDHVYAVFNIDLWEHAYIESHGADVEGYLRAWWDVVDWERLDGEYIRKLRQWSSHRINLNPIEAPETLMPDTPGSRLYTELLERGVLSSLVGLTQSGTALEALTAVPAGMPLFEFTDDSIIRGSLGEIKRGLEEIQQLSSSEGLWGAYLKEAEDNVASRGDTSAMGHDNGTVMEALAAISPSLYAEVSEIVNASSPSDRGFLDVAVLTDSIRLGRRKWVLLPGSQLVRQSSANLGTLHLTETDRGISLVASSDLEIGDALALEWQGTATLAAVQGLHIPSEAAPLGAEIQIATWEDTHGMSHRCRRLLTSTFLRSGKSPIPRGLVTCVKRALKDMASSRSALEIATYQLISEACRAGLGRVMTLETSLDSAVRDAGSLVRCVNECDGRMEIEESQFDKLAGRQPG